MNLAIRDIRRHKTRFLLTCVGLGLLLTVVMAMSGIYRGLIGDATKMVEATRPRYGLFRRTREAPSQKAHDYRKILSIPLQPSKESGGHLRSHSNTCRFGVEISRFGYFWSATNWAELAVHPWSLMAAPSQKSIMKLWLIANPGTQSEIRSISALKITR